jgi:hypothetical protein
MFKIPAGYPAHNSYIAGAGREKGSLIVVNLYFPRENQAAASPVDR